MFINMSFMFIKYTDLYLSMTYFYLCIDFNVDLTRMDFIYYYMGRLYTTYIDLMCLQYREIQITHIHITYIQIRWNIINTT